ncbi:MAG: hypothetical protein QW420_03010 [Candidatus Caldarchaeum sp.]
MRVYRQGDVILRRIAWYLVPKQAERLAEVAVEGETGNKHRLVGSYEAYTVKGLVYVLVKKASVMEHPEHMPLRVPRGAYLVTRVRSFDRDEYVRSGAERARLGAD